MPSRDTDQVLRTIAENIGLARQFVGGLTTETFGTDIRSQYAVIRCLEIVSEASRRLPEELKGRHPDVPWQRIAAAGNVYRHDYEDILPSVLWFTVMNQLDALEYAVRHELQEPI